MNSQSYIQSRKVSISLSETTPLEVVIKIVE